MPLLRRAGARDPQGPRAARGRRQGAGRVPAFDLLSRIGDYPIRATSAFAVVLEKSGPEVAKKFHDLLYENQPPRRTRAR